MPTPIQSPSGYAATRAMAFADVDGSNGTRRGPSAGTSIAALGPRIHISFEFQMYKGLTRICVLNIRVLFYSVCVATGLPPSVPPGEFLAYFCRFQVAEHTREVVTDQQSIGSGLEPVWLGLERIPAPSAESNSLACHEGSVISPHRGLTSRGMRRNQ